MTSKNPYQLRKELAQKTHREALLSLRKTNWQPKWDLRYRKFLGFLEGEKKAKVLDLGSGVASIFLRLLKKEGYINLFGLELSQAAEEEAKKHGIKVLVGDLETDDLVELFGHQQFDFVILGDTIEHLFFPREALVKIRSIMKSGGKLILSTPNAGYWFNGPLLTFFPRLLPYLSTAFGPEKHFHFFTTVSLKKLLHETGFKIEGFKMLPHPMIKPVRKSFKIKLAALVLNFIYRVTNFFNRFFPSLFGLFIIVKAEKK
jgi:methionine biosynthesis protein MetW